MKKFLSLLLIVCLSISLSACSVNKSTVDNSINSFCVECGGEISSDDKFCGSCGVSIIKQNSSEITIDNTSNDSSFSSAYDINIHTTTKIETAKPVATTKFETTKPIVTTRFETTKPITTTTPPTTVHTHVFSSATCLKPSTCNICGVKIGAVSKHSYNNGKCVWCGTSDPNFVKTYGLGDTWVIDGVGEVTFDSAKVHYLCNDHSNERYGYTNEQVVTVTYHYKNTGCTDSDGWYFPLLEFLYDEQKTSAAGYGCIHEKDYSKFIRVGETCYVQQTYVLRNPSNKITYEFQTNTYEPKVEHYATFVIPLS